MSKTTDIPKISSLDDLLAIAWKIEADAVERYKLLAEQMDTHNNPDLAAVFLDLARAESIHRDEIRRQAGDLDIEAHAEKVAKWGGESPEEVDMGDAHYMMTPWHALRMALAGEERALAYFTHVVETVKDKKIKEMAKEFQEEEAEHVNLCHRLLRKYPVPEGETWADDPDPPVSPE